MSLHVDDLTISGTPEFLTWFLKQIKEHFTVGHEDKNDLTFTGERVRWFLMHKVRRSIFRSINSFVFPSLTNISFEA